MSAFEKIVLFVCMAIGLVASQATDEIDLNALVASVIANEGKGITDKTTSTTASSVMKVS